MTCGACSPESFRTKKGSRVWGYAVSADAGQLSTQVRRLHFLGAEHVFADFPVGQLRHRPGYRHLSQLSVYLRPGDTLLLADKRALGAKTNRAEAIIDGLTADGIEVSMIRPEFFEEEQQP